MSAETFTDGLRRRTRERLSVCPTCGQPTATTREMAEIVGSTNTTIWRFLRGGEPSADLINKLVAWLDSAPASTTGPAHEAGK